MPNAFCDNCLHRFEEADLAPHEGRRLCRTCIERARNAPKVPNSGAAAPRQGLLLCLRDEASAWCAGRSWKVRLPLLLWLAYLLVRHWADARYQSIVHPLNLGIHELGHILFGWCGEFIGMAGGTILQCLAPVLSMAMFFRARDFFAIAFCFGWLSTNFFGVAEYAADARAMMLPLVRPGGGTIIHDWNYLLDTLGLLEQDRTIGFLFRVAASVSMFIALAGGGWLLWRMARTRGEKPRPPAE